MKIAVLGATGQTGLYLVHQALQQGHTVTAVIRNPRKLTVHHDNLKVQCVTSSVLLVDALIRSDSVELFDERLNVSNEGYMY